MSLLDRLRRPSAGPAACCHRCQSFEGDARRLEAALPGLASLSSGSASVWGDDGLCAVHERFTSARGSCAAFAPRAAAPFGSRQPS